MNNQLLDILACPICCGSLCFIREQNQLVCKYDKLYFQICNGIPMFFDNQSEDSNIQKS